MFFFDHLRSDGKWITLILTDFYAFRRIRRSQSGVTGERASILLP
jgi:hypothetical protein